LQIPRAVAGTLQVAESRIDIASRQSIAVAVRFGFSRCCLSAVAFGAGKTSKPPGHRFDHHTGKGLFVVSAGELGSFVPEPVLRDSFAKATLTVRVVSHRVEQPRARRSYTNRDAASLAFRNATSFVTRPSIRRFVAPDEVTNIGFPLHWDVRR